MRSGLLSLEFSRHCTRRRACVLEADFGASGDRRGCEGETAAAAAAGGWYVNHAARGHGLIVEELRDYSSCWGGGGCEVRFFRNGFERGLAAADLVYFADWCELGDGKTRNGLLQTTFSPGSIYNFDRQPKLIRDFLWIFQHNPNLEKLQLVEALFIRHRSYICTSNFRSSISPFPCIYCSNSKSSQRRYDLSDSGWIMK